MITTQTGAKKLEANDNWTRLVPNSQGADSAFNDSVDAADRIQPEIAPIINGKRCNRAVAQDEFVLLRNSTITGKANGAYQATKAIPADTDIDSTYIANNPIGGGIANALINNITNLSSKVVNYIIKNISIDANGDGSIASSQIGGKVFSITDSGGWKVAFGDNGSNIYVNVYELTGSSITHPSQNNRTLTFFYV